MILDSVVNPITTASYTFPRAQIALSVPNERRNPTFIVPGGGGPINPKGQSPFDREVNIISYQFLVTPRHDHETFDDARDAFLRAVDHGLPQTLTFLTDSGATWRIDGVLLRNPLKVGVASPFAETFRVDWVVQSDYLKTVSPNAVVYGHGHKYGTTGLKYGSSFVSYPLTTTPAALIAIDNSASGATAPTSDSVFSFVGPYGPLVPSEASFIAVTCVESTTTFWIPTTLQAGETLLVDLAARRVLKNGQPIFGLLRRPSGQQNYMSFVAYAINHVSVYITGTPLASLNGTLTIKWNPKRGF